MIFEFCLIHSRHKICLNEPVNKLILFSSRFVSFLYAAFGQLLRESGQFECWDGDGKSLADMMETRKVGMLFV